MADGPLDVAAVQAAVADFPDPETGRSVLKMDQVRDIQLADGCLTLTLALSTWAGPIATEVRDAFTQRLRGAFPQLRAVTVQPAVHARPPQKSV